MRSPKIVTRIASTAGRIFRSLRDISVYSDAVNSLVSLANVSTTSGQAINERTAISLVSVYSAIRNIADDIGKMERAVFQKLPRGKVQIFDHPMHRIMCQSPNPEMGPMDFFRSLIGSACLFGNSYAEIIRDRYTGFALHTYPIHPWRVRALRDEKGMLFYSVDGARRVEIGDMIHVKNFGTNGILGIMTIRSAKESLGLTMAVEQYGAAFFGNSALPKGVFYSDLPLNKEAREALKKSWDRNNRGAQHAQGTAVMEHGLKWQQMSVNNNEGQFLETRSFQILDVCRLFRLPPHKLMDVSRGTMNNMEQQNGEYVQDCLMSWIVQIEQELKRKLTRPEEVTIYPKFLVRSFFRGDMKARTEYIQTLVSWGVINRNEARELEDFNPVGKELDTFLVPQNFSAASALENLTKSQLTLLMLQTKAAGMPQLDDKGELIPGNPVPTRLALPAPAADTTDTGNDEQADPAEQVIPEMNVPPAPGVVLPGTQPIDDSFFGRSDSFIGRITAALKTQAPSISATVDRMLHTEQDKVIRAAKKENFSKWSEEFYGKHVEYVRSALKPVITASCESAFIAAGKEFTDELRTTVNSFVDSMAQEHVKCSQADLVDSEGLEQRVQNWDVRSAPFATAQVKALVALIVPQVPAAGSPPAK